MTGLIIYEVEGSSYLGTAAPSCLSDYCEHKKLGAMVKKYIDSYLDFETQLITLRPYSIYDAKELCAEFKKNRIDTGIILYCDCDEKPYEYTEEFIGFDVCAGDYYVSPLGLGYLEMTSEDIEYMGESEFTNDYPFFENLDDDVRYGYADKLNDSGLFDDKETADEIAEYCNWLSAQYDDVFEGLGDFRVVKIYKVK